MKCNKCAQNADVQIVSTSGRMCIRCAEFFNYPPTPWRRRPERRRPTTFGTVAALLAQEPEQ